MARLARRRTEARWSHIQEQTGDGGVPIPSLDANGLLPPGVHDCTLPEIRMSFTWNAHRLSLFSGLENCITSELHARFVGHIYCDGSFVTDKVDPRDVDLCLDLRSTPGQNQWLGLQYFQTERSRLQSQYHVDFWINVDLQGSNDFSRFFQYVGQKTALAKGLQPADTKGILRLVR